MLKIKFFGLFAICMVPACATNKGGYKEAANVEGRLLQLSDVELRNRLGAPTEELKVNSSTKVWT